MVDKQEAFDRILITPQKRGKHVIMKTCAQEGQLETRVLAKSDGPAYKEARKVLLLLPAHFSYFILSRAFFNSYGAQAAWGDGFAFPDGTSKRDLDAPVHPKPFKYRSLAKAGEKPSSRGVKLPRSAEERKEPSSS